MYPNLQYFSEDTRQDLLGWCFDHWTWKWSGHRNIRKDNLQSEFANHLFGLLLLPKCRCSSDEHFALQKMPAASRNYAMSINYSYLMFSDARFCPEPPWSLGIPNVFSRFLKDLRLSPVFSPIFPVFSEVLRFFTKFFKHVPRSLPVLRVCGPFSTHRAACQRLAKSGGRRSHHPGSLGCALNSNEFVNQW